VGDRYADERTELWAKLATLREQLNAAREALREARGAAIELAAEVVRGVMSTGEGMDADEFERYAEHMRGAAMRAKKRVDGTRAALNTGGE